MDLSGMHWIEVEFFEGSLFELNEMKWSEMR